MTFANITRNALVLVGDGGFGSGGLAAVVVVAAAVEAAGAVVLRGLMVAVAAGWQP